MTEQAVGILPTASFFVFNAGLVFFVKRHLRIG